MNDPKDLIGKAADLLGSEEGIIAAGIFGLKDNYVGAGMGMAGGGTLGEVVLDNPLGGAAGLHASRSARAASKGVTVRMLVAVTAERIRVLDWVTGSGPTKELLCFDRSCTDVKITKFGLSRHVALSDAGSGHSLVLTGSTAPFASESKGDKAVLGALSTSR
jgi:hypothetical protein